MYCWSHVLPLVIVDDLDVIRQRSLTVIAHRFFRAPFNLCNPRGAVGRRPCGDRRFGRAPDGDQGRGKIRLHFRQGGIRQRGPFGRVRAWRTSAAVFRCDYRCKRADLTPLSAFFKGFSLTGFSSVCAPAATAFWGELAIVVAIGLGNRCCSRTTVMRSGPSAYLLRKSKMKKLVLALSAVAAFTGSALAADLPARTYTKAPMMSPAPSWTGFYIFGGGGYGMFDSNTFVTTFPGGTPLTIGQKVGGDGYFGTVGAGYDWQFNGSLVAGIFADGQFGSIKGSLTDPLLGATGVSGSVKD